MNIESIVGLGLVAVGIAIALWGASRPNRIELNGESLTIKGNYSHTIAICDIESVVLADKLPEIVLRTNGIGFRHIKVGHFRLKGTGKCRLYVNLRYPPYIHIVTVTGEHVFFNTPDPDYTRELYNTLISSRNQCLGDPKNIGNRDTNKG